MSEGLNNFIDGNLTTSVDISAIRRHVNRSHENGPAKNEEGELLKEGHTKAVGLSYLIQKEAQISTVNRDISCSGRKSGGRKKVSAHLRRVAFQSVE